jgi:hypothetical protein
MRGKDIFSLSNCLLVKNRKQKNRSQDNLPFTDMLVKTFFYFYKHAKLRRNSLLGPGPLNSVLSVCFKCKSQRESRQSYHPILLHVFTLEIAGDVFTLEIAGVWIQHIRLRLNHLRFPNQSKAPML